MSSSGTSRGTIAALIFGGLSLVSLSLWLYFRWFGSSSTPSRPLLKDDPSATKKAPATVATTVEDDGSSSEEEEDSDEEEDVKKQPNKSDSSSSTPPPTVDPAAEAAAAEAAELKNQYDTLVRMSTKLIQGNAHERAIESLTQAIELAKKVPSAAKDVVTLYNNRSAMYEKVSSYDAAIRDITVVLTLDPLHLKAKIRRARVYEAQNKKWEALQDYVFAMIVERFKNEQPSNERKIQVLAKVVGSERATVALNDLRAQALKSERALPSKSYIRSIIESFPSFFAWQEQFPESSTKISTLKVAYDEAKSKLLLEKNADNQNNLLQQGLNLLHLQLLKEKFEESFTTLREVSGLADELIKEGQLDTKIVSQLRELQGLESHLRLNTEMAQQRYKEAMFSNPDNISAALKYCFVLLDLGKLAEAKAEYDKLLNHLSEDSDDNSVASLNEEDEALFKQSRALAASPAPPSPREKSVKDRMYKSWVLVHRASYFIARDAQGNYQPNAVENALRDLEDAIILTESISSMEAKGARFTAFLKSVHVRTQTKAAMEQQPTEEDGIRNRQCVDSAKTIFPEHDSIIISEADQLSNENRVDEALALLSRPDKADDVTFLMIRASVLTTRAFADLANPAAHVYVQAQLGEVAAIYQRALEIEPNAIEVMAQFAQLKSMVLGDLEGALQLLQQALPLTRSRDEVLEICQMLVMTEAQVNAIKKIQNQEA